MFPGNDSISSDNYWQGSAARRVVLLGASNIARNAGTVLSTARSAWGTPLDVLAAFGHGRSYGMTSCVLGRTLPSILRCGLWEALAARPAAQTAALVTDIGNDILYGARADQIARWVERCLVRLTPQAERIAITELPLASIEKLGPARFHVARTLLFPRSRLTLADALDTARRLNDTIIALAEQFGAALVRPQRVWYGLDPIHIRWHHTPNAWRTILSTWHDRDKIAHTSLPLLHALQLRFLRPEQRHLFGMEQRQTQPAAILPDGTALSLF